MASERGRLRAGDGRRDTRVCRRARVCGSGCRENGPENREGGAHCEFLSCVYSVVGRHVEANRVGLLRG